MTGSPVVPTRRPVRIGLTGPIGCGKSTVAGWLATRGAAVVDADALARDVTAPGTPGHDAVLSAFGDRVRRADGTLDRAALARIVFTDPDALRELEGIVHPLVRPRIVHAIEAATASGSPAIVIEAIKLVEGGLHELCDHVWFVTCDDQRARLIGRGMDAADADRRIDAQAGLEAIVRSVRGNDLTIVATAGSLADAEARVAGLWARTVPAGNR